jgi:protein-tyrosine phosphatase
MAARLFELRNPIPEIFSVFSAGVSAPVGRPMDPPSAQMLRELGGNPAGHRARQLEAQFISSADLILTADATHRSAVLGMEPLAFRRTFTYREFGRLGRGMPRLAAPSATALVARVAAVAARRGLEDAVRPQANDIADPYGASMKSVRLIAAQVSDAVDAILAALGLAPTQAGDDQRGDG